MNFLGPLPQAHPDYLAGLVAAVLFGAKLLSTRSVKLKREHVMVSPSKALDSRTTSLNCPKAHGIFWAALLAIVAGTVNASDTYGFKVYQLGSDFKVLEEYRPNSGCKTPQDTVAGDKTCFYPDGADSIAGANIKELGLFYYGDKLNFIHLVIDVRDFGTVVEALKDRYGQPIKKTSTVRTKAGVVYTNEQYSWDNRESNIVADLYAESVEKSNIVFSLKSGILESKRRDQERRKQRQKDL
jgi:hypothetical protein